MYKNKARIDHESEIERRRSLLSEDDDGTLGVNPPFNMSEVSLPDYPRRPHAYSSDWSAEVLPFPLFFCFLFASHLPFSLVMISAASPSIMLQTPLFYLSVLLVPRSFPLLAHLFPLTIHRSLLLPLLPLRPIILPLFCSLPHTPIHLPTNVCHFLSFFLSCLYSSLLFLQLLPTLPVLPSTEVCLLLPSLSLLC